MTDFQTVLEELADLKRKHLEVIHFTGQEDDSILDWSKPEVIVSDMAAFKKTKG